MSNKSKSIRTTVYMSQIDKDVLKKMSELTGKNQSEIVRLALDHYSYSDEFEKLEKSKNKLERFINQMNKSQ